jgi:hypothetical protein
MGRGRGVNGINEINVRINLKKSGTNIEHFLHLILMFLVFSVCDTDMCFHQKKMIFPLPVNDASDLL